MSAAMLTRQQYLRSGLALAGAPPVLQACSSIRVDPDDHHLHVSLGCAVENLVQA
jgi:hypothetical protein